MAKDEKYDTSGFYPDEEWQEEGQPDFDIMPDEDYPDEEPVIMPVKQSSGKRRIDFGDTLPAFKKEKGGKNVKTTNRKNGRKK